LITKLTSPLKYLSAFILAQKCSPPGIRNRLWYVAYLKEACFLARRLKAHRIDHLHNHLGRGSATVAMLASRLSGVPYSLTIHGPTEFDEPKALALGRKIERAAFVVGVSQFGRSQLCRWSDAKYWDKIHVVHCGLDRSFLDHAVTPVPAEPRFVCVARLAEQKGLTILLQAAAKLHKDGVWFELTIVGDGPLRQEIERMIDRDDLRRCVRLAGWQNSAQIREHLLASRVFVMPSFAEGLPVVLMESLALSRPVISTQIAGIPELVRNGESGWLIPPGSVDALATAMKRAIDASNEEVATMAKNGRERVRLAFDRAAEVQKLAKLFETSVSRRNPGASQ
jgi:colanic acid/amylovoran biosynthesis glycosyltransferase